MVAAGDEEDEENERVALSEPCPWKVQYIVCHESRWSSETGLQILMPELPSVTLEYMPFIDGMAISR